MALAILQPNRIVSRRTRSILTIGWILFVFFTWWQVPFKAIPTPWEVLGAIPRLVTEQELLPNLFASLSINAKALFISTVICLGFSYASVIPLFRWPAEALGTIRYLGFAGVSLVCSLIFHHTEDVRVSLMVFGIVGFFLASMHDEVKRIPRSHFDYARTLGVGEWRVVWLVVVRGTLPSAWDIFRQNAAMGWVLLTIVETWYRDGGGVGVMLADGRKHDYAAMFAVQVVIFVTGLCQDAIIGLLKGLACPYAMQTTERQEAYT